MGLKKRTTTAKGPNRGAMDELLALLPFFEAQECKPVESWAGGETRPGVFTWPYPNYVDEVERFVDVASQEFWNDYDYVDKNVSGWFEKPGFVERADLAEIKSMLTFIMRGERFCDGHIEAMIDAGHVLRILRRLAVVRGAT